MLSNHLLVDRFEYNSRMALQHKPFQEMIVKGWLGEENVENLKWYARLLGADRKIIRKPELVDLIAAHLNGGHLREIWSRLDDIQQAAANAEAVKNYCLRAGDRHLVVPANREQHFRRELERLGYILSF